MNNKGLAIHLITYTNSFAITILNLIDLFTKYEH